MMAKAPGVFISLPVHLSTGEATFWGQALRDDDVLAEVVNGSDRVLAVLGGSAVETAMKDMLARCLVDDVDAQKRLIGLNGPLAAFGAQLNLAYLMGLIDENVRSDLKRISTIRNAFAHEPKGLAFSASPIREHCRDLRLPDIYVKLSGAEPRSGILLHAEHGGRVIQIGLNLGGDADRLKEPRWRFEVAVQIAAFILARTSQVIPAAAKPQTSWGTQP